MNVVTFGTWDLLLVFGFSPRPPRLIKQLATRLSGYKTPAKSLVISVR